MSLKPTAGRGLRRRLSLAIVGALAAQACAPVYWLGVTLFYDKAPSPPAVQLAVSYDTMAPADPKRQLDLYLPAGASRVPPQRAQSARRGPRLAALLVAYILANMRAPRAWRSGRRGRQIDTASAWTGH